MSQDGASAGGDGSGPSEKRVELVLITGYSGAGKSEAIAAFEDGGYFCVDTLPPRMIGSLGELFQHEGSGVQRAAVVTDVRGGEYFEDLLAVLGESDAGVLDEKLVFLEADEEALLHRYKETRRRHPLARSGGLGGGIRAGRELLGPPGEGRGRGNPRGARAAGAAARARRRRHRHDLADRRGTAPPHRDRADRPGRPGEP